MLLTIFIALPVLTLLSMPDGHILGREQSLPEPHEASGKTTLMREGYRRGAIWSRALNLYLPG